MSLSYRVVLALHLIACKGLRGGSEALQPAMETSEGMPIDILE